MARFSQFTSSSKQEKVSSETIQERFDSYKNMSKQQLNDALLSEVAKQKQSGNFDYQQLKNMVDALQGVISQKDYQNVVELLESLK